MFLTSQVFSVAVDVPSLDAGGGQFSAGSASGPDVRPSAF